mgnify:CR=1 FL=1
MAPLVAIKGLAVDFGGAVAVDGVDLEVAPGEALGIVGESGSGKSVTWLAALGLLPAKARVAGSVKFAGQELVGAPARRLEAVRGRRIAMIFQDPSSCLNPVRRIGWQLGEALRLYRGLEGRTVEREALRLLDQVGIAHFVPTPAEFRRRGRRHCHTEQSSRHKNKKPLRRKG